MKGSTPTKSHRALWDKLAAVGCIACRHDGIFNPHVSIHHVDGRTKEKAHEEVLAICGPHHQHVTGSGVWGIHPYKARFEAEYGSQYELMAEQKKLAGISSN
jgi:Recombination enhancement, RecA-dependent nuclease